ncbi:MAG: carboxyl transferase [Lachnospiraceae bacterium]|nr:carboxyl transferase [Lachnospiraceae bacterium]
MSNSNALSARERIKALTDENSFVEIGALVTKRNTDFNMDEQSVPDDGVVTGYALINEKPVYIYSQDAAQLNGSIGEMHARKIVNIYKLAIKTGTPVVGLLDSAGIRVQESVDALASFGEIYNVMAEARGLVPQITAVMGNCGGGVAILASLSDFTFMEKENGRFFVNSPNTLDNNYKEKLNTAGGDFAGKTGNADFVISGEEELFTTLRDLVHVLPLNYAEEAGADDVMDDLNREVPEFASLVKDPAVALEDLSDNNFFLEVQKDTAKEMVTGFILLDGMTIGAVANRTAVLDENGAEVETFEPRLTTAGCYKAANFVKVCNSFNIPVLTLTNVIGYAATVAEEATIGGAVTTLTTVFASAGIPKVNLIVGNAYGSAYLSMNSTHIGADMEFALPNVKVGLMDANIAAKIMYPNADKDEIKTRAKEFNEKTDVKASASRGFIDAIIEPASVRKHLLFAFEMLSTKADNE